MSPRTCMRGAGPEQRGLTLSGIILYAKLRNELRS
jgi:hypothetical protein